MKKRIGSGVGIQARGDVANQGRSVVVQHRHDEFPLLARRLDASLTQDLDMHTVRRHVIAATPFALVRDIVGLVGAEDVDYAGAEDALDQRARVLAEEFGFGTGSRRCPLAAQCCASARSADG